MRKMLLLWIIGFAILPSSSGAQWGGDHEYCSAYAREKTSPAVKKAMETCGYSGDEWNADDYLGHYNFCLNRNIAHVLDPHLAWQRMMIQKCEDCTAYADSAVAQQTFNEGEAGKQPTEPVMACGYTGDPWSKDRENHIRWCVGVSVEEGDAQTIARTKWNDICNTCRGYAREAVGAYHQVWTNCRSFWTAGRMSEADWSIDHNHHFKWCMGHSAEHRGKSLDFQNNYRNRIVQAWKAKVQAPLTIQPAAKAQPRKAVGSEPKRAATKPVQAARQPPDRSAETSRQKVPAGSGSSAMDRLSPDGGGSASTGGGGSARGPGVGGGARSSISPSQPSARSGGGGSVMPATTINRNAIGGGSERVR